MRLVSSNLFLPILALASLMVACDTGGQEACTVIDPDPFLPHVNFDGSTRSHVIQGWGARGVFSTQDADDLIMNVRSSDPGVVAIEHVAPTEAQATLDVRGAGSAEITVSVGNACGDTVTKSFSVDAILPLGREGAFCESRPSGRWTDYWPLETGNSWTFYYEARVSDADGGYRRQGQAVLSILSTACRASRREYTASMSYDYVVFLNSQRDDTNKRWVYTDTLTIVEDDLGQLALVGFGEVEQLKIREIRAQRWHKDADELRIDLLQEWPELDRAESRIILEKGRGPGTISLSAHYADVLQDDFFRLMDWYVASEL